MVARDYLAMIADIGETQETIQRYEKNELHEISRRPVTPAAILAVSLHGSLTRGGLRDALVIAARHVGMPCSEEDALLCIDVAVEAGIIVEGGDGLCQVKQ